MISIRRAQQELRLFLRARSAEQVEVLERRIARGRYFWIELEEKSRVMDLKTKVGR
jgi:hypothetical protein